MFLLSSRALFLGLFVLSCLGCSSNTNKPLTVFAAASLTDVFEAGRDAFETRHPGVEVHLQFAGSQILHLQIQEGAKAHVLASANARHVRTLFERGYLLAPTRFATNQMALIVPKGNPKGWSGLNDLATADRWVIGDENVPAGAYARVVLQRATQEYGTAWRSAVEQRIGSHEPNVRWVRTKVALGEADAGFVYASDVTEQANVSVIRLNPDHQVHTELFMGLHANHTHPSAEDWQTFWLSDTGQQLLNVHGFQRNTP